jgi:RND family efflux transporter MFP subunit
MMETSDKPANPKRYRKFIPVLGLVMVLVAGIVLHSLISGQPTTAASYEAIKTGTVTRHDLTGDVRVTGVLDSVGKANISSPVSGLVAQVTVKEGSQVIKGQVLATLDKRDFEVQLHQAEINLQKAQYAVYQARISYDQAEADFQRSQKLYEANAISRSEWEQIKQKRDLYESQYENALNTGVPAAEESLQQARLSLSKTDLVSPVDGVVAACTINPGDFINANTSGPVINIITDGQMVLAGNTPEKTVSLLKSGQTADIKFDNLPSVSISGEVSYLGAESIPSGQLFPLKIKLHNSNSLLKPGMTATAAIHVTIKDSIVIPAQAVFRRNGQNCVFVVKNGKAVQTNINTGLKGDNAVAVQQGLNPGEQIVIAGTDALIDGMTLPPDAISGSEHK